MAACFFLLKQFDDVLLYLNSIKSYYYNEDTFNYNYGQAKGQKISKGNCGFFNSPPKTNEKNSLISALASRKLWNQKINAYHYIKYKLFNIIFIFINHFYVPGQKFVFVLFCFFGRIVDTTISLWNVMTFKASVGNFKDAEEIFLQVQGDKLQNDYAYLSWLARCYIMNGKARLAWELYLKMETSKCFWSHFFTYICKYKPTFLVFSTI